MKIINKIVAILLLFSILSLSFAWNDCPYGRVNCTYPGECGRYIDTNHNGICDHSEPPPTTTIKTTNNEEEIKTSNVSSLELTEELINEYVGISGKELKSYTIKQVCDKYGISPKCLKEKLNINVPDDTTFGEIKEVYGIPPSVIKKAIVECMIEEGKIKLNTTNTIDNNRDLNNNNSGNEKVGNTILDKIVSFLFSTINLRDLLFKF
ncbi:hypothetical protein [Methanocaldococcus jannaschii]|nr:hypothetical protein [Methanocaldococcus jannaschii]